MMVKSFIFYLLGFILSRKIKRENVNIKAINSVLLVNTQGIGDFVMVTSLAKELSKKYTVDVLTLSKITKKISPKFINNILCYSSFFKTISDVNKNKYDGIILTHGAGPISGFMFMFMRAKYKLSHIYTLSGFKTSFYASSSVDLTSKMHRVDENLKFLKFFGISTPEKVEYSIRVLPSSKNFVKKYFKENNLVGKEIIGIHPGGSGNNPQKRYPIERYCSFVNSLGLDSKALFFLGPDEFELEDKINKLCTKDNYFIIKTSFENSVALINNCNILLHADSVFGHIASALDVKTLTIVGPTNWLRTRPYGKKDKILKHPAQKEPVDNNMEEGFISKKNFKFPKKIILE